MDDKMAKRRSRAANDSPSPPPRGRGNPPSNSTVCCGLRSRRQVACASACAFSSGTRRTRNGACPVPSLNARQTLPASPILPPVAGCESMVVKYVWRWVVVVSGVLALTDVGAAPKGKAEHVVVLVWDGMRPDFITPQYTPNLYSLAANGVFFKHHHPLYISSTEVNGTGLATGVYPNRSGIMANSDYRPEIGWLGPQGTESLDAVRRGDLWTGGNYLGAATVAEILQKKGHPTVIAGTKAVALLHDRSSRKTTEAGKDSILLYRGQTIPRYVRDSLIKVNDDKQFPTNTTHPNTGPDGWTTKALTHGLWRKGVPLYTLLWLSEPDASQHETGPGSDTSP